MISNLSSPATYILMDLVIRSNNNTSLKDLFSGSTNKVACMEAP